VDTSLAAKLNIVCLASSNTVGLIVRLSKKLAIESTVQCPLIFYR